MITQQTVLILGAGASYDYGFPLGQTLVQQICAFGEDVLRELSEFGDVQGFHQALRATRPYSIDFFLEHRPEFLQPGKAAISYCLIRCEDESRFSDNAPNHAWYDYLFNVVLRASFDRFQENKLAVVTFNYDRSFEYALMHRMVNLFGKPEEECAQKLTSIPIVHVHGHLGAMPWLKSG